MVPDRNESRATARLTGILHRKKMMVGGMPVLPVFGTLTCVLHVALYLRMEIFLDAIFFSAYNRLDPQCNKEDFKSPKTDLILFFLNIQMMIFSRGQATL